MPIDVQMPDGTIITGVPDNVTQADLMARYQSFAATPMPPDMRKPEDVGFLEGAKGALKRGVESFEDVTGGLGLAKTAITGTETETAQKMTDIKRAQAKPPETPGLAAADIERLYKEKGLGAAAGQVPSYVTQQILQSAPQMAVPLAAGAAAGAVSGPFAPVVAPIVGVGTYGIQQFGNFLTRQAVEKKDPKELELTKAALTAGATAPLGYFADRFTVGLGSLGTKKAGAEIMKELSARQIAAQVGKRTVVGATQGIIAEAPLEVLEQAAERYQAGLSLTGDDATNEYKEAFFGAAGAGAGIGGGSRGIQGYKEARAQGVPPEAAPPQAAPVTPPTPAAAAPVEPVPDAPVPQAGGQDIQAMIDELRGITPAPAAPVEAQPVAQPVQQPVQVPQAAAPQVAPEVAKPTTANLLDNAFLWRKDGVDTPIQVVAERPNKNEIVALVNGQETNIPINEVIRNSEWLAEQKPAAQPGFKEKFEQTKAIETELKDLYKERNQLTKSGDNLVPWLKKYGVKPEAKADMGIEKGDRRLPVGIFKKSGYGLDELARAAVNDGIITEADLARQPDEVEAFRELVYDALQGNVSQTPVNMERMAKLDAVQARIEQLEQPEKFGLQAETAQETEVRMAQEVEQKKAQESQAIQAEMDAQAERDRAEIARRSEQQADSFALGQTPEESLTGQQRLDDDIPFFERKTSFTDKFIADEEKLKTQLRTSLDKMGLKDVGLKLEDTVTAVINGKQEEVNGQYLQSLISLSLSGSDIYRTMNHEALHAMKDLGFFSEKDWNLLTSKARSDWMEKYNIKSLYGDQSIEIQEEEAIAKAFADYQTQEPKIKSIMSRVVDFIKKIGNVLRGNGFKVSDDVFSAAAKGELKATKPAEAEARYERVEKEPDYEGEARNYKGKPVKATWDLPEDTTTRVLSPFDETVQGLIYKFQDKQIDTKDAQAAIMKAAGKIADEQDVYEQEQLYHGRTATGIREFLLDELLPAIKELQKLGLTPQEVKDYLHNRHAEERNNKMNEVNKLDPVTGKERETPWELQDKASGIATKDARDYLAKLDPEKKAALEKVADRFDKMVKDTQKILVESGAESKDTVEAWNNTYEHYVPLFRIEDDFNKVSGGMGATGASKGFGTRGGFSKRAMGSEKEVQDILGNLIAQRERALIRAEKIKVGKALYALAIQNPNPDVWLPVNPDAIKSKADLIKELEGLGFEDAASIADNLMEEPKTRYISKEKKQIIDPVTGLPMMVNQEAVKLKIDNLKRFGDNVFPIRINGKDRYIFFNKNNPRAVRMVHSLLNLDVDNLGFVTSNIAKLTRWFAAVNTQYNPIFGAVNLIRDVGGANFNLTSTAIAGEQGKVTKGVYPAMRGILNVLRDERKGKTDTKGKWAKAFQEFRKEGGQTGYRDSLIRTEEEKQVIERELGKVKAGNAKKAFTAVMGALSDFNDMMENSVRVSAYVAARDKGLSPQKAAILAKNLTVNFDKKGQLSAAINAYYAFFNASVQGSARLIQTLKGPKGKAIMAGGIGLGAMQAVLLAAAGYDDDEPPEFVKERNFIVPLPTGKYLSIPYPLGLHVLPNIGRITTEAVLTGGKDIGKKVANMTGAFADAFSPIGSSGLSLQSALPTVLDPFAALEANKDAFGRPIYKKDQATNPTPGYLRSRDSSSEISKTIAYYLNLASGGTKYSKGFISPTADEIDYVAGQITGGVGREALKLEQSIKGAITGEEVPSYRIPLAGRFYGETESPAAEAQRFYNNVTKMADHENEIKGRMKNKEPIGPYLREHPEARLWQMANTTENQINALNKQKKDFIEKGLPKDRIKRIENQKAVIMKRFNDHLEKVEK